MLSKVHESEITQSRRIEMNQQRKVLVESDSDVVPVRWKTRIYSQVPYLSLTVRFINKHKLQVRVGNTFSTEALISKVYLPTFLFPFPLHPPFNLSFLLLSPTSTSHFQIIHNLPHILLSPHGSYYSLILRYTLHIFRLSTDCVVLTESNQSHRPHDVCQICSYPLSIPSHLHPCFAITESNS